jgi:hypothetical protein
LQSRVEIPYDWACKLDFEVNGRILDGYRESHDSATVSSSIGNRWSGRPGGLRIRQAVNILSYSFGEIDPLYDVASVHGLVMGMCIKDFQMDRPVT